MDRQCIPFVGSRVGLIQIRGHLRQVLRRQDLSLGRDGCVVHFVIKVLSVDGREVGS